MEADSSIADAKTLIGWREFVSLPEWGIKAIRAKIDTGARTSALHVERLELLSDGGVRFDVVFGSSPQRRMPVEAELARVSTVRPSTGEVQRRYVVTTRMRLGPVEREIQLALVSRRGMLCRMLVGRRALGDDFIVDPTAKYLLRRLPGRRSGDRP